MVLLVVGCMMLLMARQMEHAIGSAKEVVGSRDVWRTDANSTILGWQVEEGMGVSW
jgi:hypothetical protein